LIVAYFYHRWFRKQLIELPFKLPQHADKLKDKNNPNPANVSLASLREFFFSVTSRMALIKTMNYG
jgi:hypothetical protein